MSLWEKGPGPEGKEQGQRAGWLGLGGAEMLRICPVSTFFMWGGRRCQGTELSENVQHRLLSKAGLPWGHSPHSSRFSDVLGGKKAQEAQRDQKIKSYMAVSAAPQPSPAQCWHPPGLSCRCLCAPIHNAHRKRKGTKLVLKRERVLESPAVSRHERHPNYKRPPKALSAPPALPRNYKEQV